MDCTLPEHFLGDIIATLSFGLVAILLVIAGYKIFDIVLTRLDFDEEIKKGNTAMGVVVGAFILGLCYVIAKVVSAIVSG